MAENFLQRLKEKDFPGVPEVTALVEQLWEESNTALWSTRILFPHLHKDRCIRVSLGYFRVVPSPLRHELLPEDVPEPPKTTQADDQDYMYDWDYIASTDPIHPVDTNYTHPLDNVDPCWMLNHLTPEEFEEPSGDVGFDVTEAETMWLNNVERTDATTETWGEIAGWTADSTTETSTEHNRRSDLEVEAPLFPPVTVTESSSEIQQLRAEQVEMVIREFWKVANDEDLSGLSSPSHADLDLMVQLNNIHISDSSGVPNEPCSGLLTPPPTPPRWSTDGPGEQCLYTTPPSSTNGHTPSLTLASHYTTTSTIPPFNQRQLTSETPTSTLTSNPTRNLYDKWRRHILALKNTDPTRYHRDLLALSRCEIKDVEGPGGRFIPDPPLSRDSSAKNGWLR